MSILHIIARHCRLRTISVLGKEYMRRYTYGRLGWLPGDKPTPVSVYLHHFIRPDEDRELHNHPWRWALSVTLAGGYTEQRFCKSEEFVRVKTPFRHKEYGCVVCGYMSFSPNVGKHIVNRRTRLFSVNFIRGTDYHRVAELHGETWTLFLAGPKTSSWGFWVPGKGHVPWREFLASKGMEAEY